MTPEGQSRGPRICERDLDLERVSSDTLRDPEFPSRALDPGTGVPEEAPGGKAWAPGRDWVRQLHAGEPGATRPQKDQEAEGVPPAQLQREARPCRHLDLTSCLQDQESTCLLLEAAGFAVICRRAWKPQGRITRANRRWSCSDTCQPRSMSTLLPMIDDQVPPVERGCPSLFTRTA